MIRRKICWVAAIAVLVLLVGPGAQAKTSGKKDVLIHGVPHVRQQPDFCGEACAEMYLRRLGHDIDQDSVFNRSGVDPVEGRGCHTRELARVLKQIGFEVGAVWYKIDAASADKQIEEQFDSLHRDLLKGIPSIICMHYDERPEASEHFRLVLGYDPKNDELIYHEPAEANGAYRRMKRRKLFKLWPLKYNAKQWTLIRIKLEPGGIKPPRSIAGFTNADYARHIMELKEEIPDRSFTIVLQRPFVVIGDESPTIVRRRAVGTIKWAVDKLKRDYFDNDPCSIIDIWLFRDKTSYRKHTWGIFRDRPNTPFGYFSNEHNSLIMNIATGGGTLVHEIVHPFMSSNFPQCPAWFNEGLASLYEQCRERNGQIHGLTNWRLSGLQKDIRAGNVAALRSLSHTTEAAFYGCIDADYYAQARYLCYYLQEKGLLRRFYREFRTNCRVDPTGFETLQKVLGVEDMAAFQRRWERFVLGLTFP